MNIGLYLDPDVLALGCGLIFVIVGYYLTYNILLVNKIGLEEVVVTSILLTTTKLIVGALSKNDQNSFLAWEIIYHEIVKLNKDNAVVDINCFFNQIEIMIVRKLNHVDINSKAEYKQCLLAVDFLTQWSTAINREISNHRLGGEYRIRVRCIVNAINTTLKDH